VGKVSNLEGSDSGDCSGCDCGGDGTLETRAFPEKAEKEGGFV
jgi:hypothetical protein